MVYKVGIRNVIVVGLGDYEASFTPLPLTALVLLSGGAIEGLNFILPQNFIRWTKI